MGATPVASSHTERFSAWSQLDTPWLDEQRNTLIIERKGLEALWAVVSLRHIANVKLCLKLIEYVLEEETGKYV
ncbi:hypothetical protein KSD_57900 [Ktedonobacter sp. SOSP1-85]|uniref:hypothetical protein n=1 Tax=Ktedonobacter sp. SOSP1-85 TaxID=2778367 RepID=UPI0019150363|nr:hypothetical protein [Ktedonobacter sp. SOSP1-85]GHO78019.1 hypothetical protein KSD_57900 [Ktedonobacter sp. SOSP1-85]